MNSIKIIFFAFLVGAATCLPQSGTGIILPYFSCSYSVDANGTYVCSLDTINSEGWNNFTSVGGTHVSGKTNADVKKIVRGSGSTSNFPKIICSQFPNLETIEYQDRGLDRIDSYSFSGCKMLKTLNLNNNWIKKIADFSFSQNGLLSEINLGRNWINSPSANAFSGLSGLQTLILSDNGIGTLPSNFFSSMPNLLYVLLERASLSAINPAWFASNLKLQQIVLSGNSITDIPAGSFTKLSNLVEISLDNNRLTTIRASGFGTYTQLHAIIFTANKINAIEKAFLDLIGSSWLFMAGNLCSTITTHANDYQAYATCVTNYKG